MTFFFDNNLSPRLVEGLRAFGEDAMHLRDEFPADTDDTVWLPEIGRRGWYLVTHDKKIRKKPAEIRALKQAGVGAFVFTQQKDLLMWGWVETVLESTHVVYERA
ncbi:MAG: hypothetical protein KatS3mg014_1084 [Actinomycetota bacterium]|nr:MAG: hypothetical protein KatS3mg014_1084 [Actinomycetota bacterium]